MSRVGTRIAAATGKADYKWEFRVIDDDKQVDAFCLPGGKVAVHTGILPIARDDAGLAVIIGHEVAHAIARHGGERVSQQLLAEGATAAAVIALGGSDPEPCQPVCRPARHGAPAWVCCLPYSRLQESEADRLGMIYMAKAGYDLARRDLWLRMAEAGKGKGKPLDILSAHPSDATRIQPDRGSRVPEAMQYYRPR
ncbi:MAG: M48 family metallopeptidase [Comamonadaceae bacterium]|nr:M48 family metallopeptidase [Comamonadaceae bacterium]